MEHFIWICLAAITLASFISVIGAPPTSESPEGNSESENPQGSTPEEEASAPDNLSDDKANRKALPIRKIPVL